MASATKKAPPIILDLSTEEAASLYSLLMGEKWPTNAPDINRLNDVFAALCDADVADSGTYEV